MVIRNKYTYLKRVDRALDHADVAIGDLIRNVGVTEYPFDRRDDDGIVRPSQLTHVSHLQAATGASK
jgi:hypothetical protein